MVFFREARKGAFVRREGGVRVRRACRARQGAADAPLRTRRSLKSAHGADDAHRRRRFDMDGRISWSRVSAKRSAMPLQRLLTLHKNLVAPIHRSKLLSVVVHPLQLNGPMEQHGACRFRRCKSQHPTGLWPHQTPFVPRQSFCQEVLEALRFAATGAQHREYHKIILRLLSPFHDMHFFPFTSPFI